MFYRMVGAGCELDIEIRGIDVTRRAESIAEGIESEETCR